MFGLEIPTPSKREIDFNQGVGIMRFTLTYDGPLPSTSRASRIREKQDIRRQIHGQLAELYATHPALRDDWPVMKWREAPPELVISQVGAFTFLPLVTTKMHLVCDVDILFLRHEAAGRLVLPGGDLDNRITTLFDALRMPRSENEIPNGDAPAPHETPLFCLLEDDSLITGVTVRTDRLLKYMDRDESNHVRLVIGVTVKITKLTWDSSVFVD